MRGHGVALLLVSLLAVSSVVSAQTWEFTLPEGSRGFNFGKLVIPGLENVMSSTTWTEERGFGWTGGEELSVAGGMWPDPLCGTYVGTLSGKPVEFRAEVPNGDYLVWLSAGKVIRPDLKERRFLLKLNERVLFDETPTDEQLAGEKYLFRFLRTQYSATPDVLWQRYIGEMYPATTLALKVTTGEVRVQAANHFLSALVIVPAAKKNEFDALVGTIREKRLESFRKSTPAAPAKTPDKPEGAGDYLLYVPDEGTAITPSTVPTDAERKRTGVDAAGAPASHVLIKLVLVPFADLGECTLELADLTGPATIPASSILGHFKNYRYGRKDVTEMGLVPGLTLTAEPGVTQSFWLWMTVPADAKPGVYSGAFTLKSQKAPAARVPVRFEVYPFRLDANPPRSPTGSGARGGRPRSFPTT